MESNSYSLSLEQQFEMRRMQDAAKGMTRDQALEMLLQASQLLMVKNNVIRDLTSKTETAYG
jgi:Phycobilisome degradation protein nblA